MSIWPAINERICKVYGLDPKEVREVMIVFSPHERPRVHIFVMPNEGVIKEIVDMIDAKDCDVSLVDYDD